MPSSDAKPELVSTSSKGIMATQPPLKLRRDPLSPEASGRDRLTILREVRTDYASLARLLHRQHAGQKVLSGHHRDSERQHQQVRARQGNRLVAARSRALQRGV